MIAQLLAISSDVSYILPIRCVVLALLGLIMPIILIKKNVKGNRIKTEKKDIFKESIIVQCLLAVVIVVYGLFSIESNLEDVKKELNSSFSTQWYLNIQSELYGYDKNELVSQLINEAREEATIIWFVSAGVFLVSSIVGVLITKKKLEKWLLDSEMFVNNEQINEEINLYGNSVLSQKDNNFSSGNAIQTEKNYSNSNSYIDLQ